MDNHNRLFAESQKYYTTQGFLAYFAPYILNDVGVYIPPTPFVTGSGNAPLPRRDRRLPSAPGRCQVQPCWCTRRAGGNHHRYARTSPTLTASTHSVSCLATAKWIRTPARPTALCLSGVHVLGSTPRTLRLRLSTSSSTPALSSTSIYGTLDGALDGQIFNVIDGRAVTFNQIRTLLTNVLYSNFYVPGALFGATASDAFEVVVDDRNNPPANLENGLVNVQVFVVPVPTLERIEIDLLRVSIGGIDDAKLQLNLQ